MEVLQEETAIMGTTHIAKRRRTKRQRRMDDANVMSFSSPASSGDSSGESATEEEKDMANCLILLAQGWPPEASAVAGNAKAARRCLYECKTCSRCFSSFQALGGHRAGHKKPKTTTATTPEKYENDDEPSPAPATRVHECSICGSEFASGQALGGHMRRHRSAMAGPSSSSSSTECKKEGGVLGLDLNLPASPEVVAGEFGFAGKVPMVLKSLTQFVDCHY